MRFRGRERLVTIGLGATLVALSGLAWGGLAAQAADPSAAPSGEGSPGLVARPLGSVDGAPLGYLEHVPAGHPDGEAPPLLVYLHSAGSPGEGTEESLALVAMEGIPLLIESGAWPAERPFVVLAPQYGEGPANSDCAIGEDLAAFLEFATQQYEVDAARVYLTGASCGAIGIWDYLGTHGDEAVAASVPIAGHAEWALEESGCEALARASVWAFHGGLDPVVPPVYIEGPMERIRACEGAESVEMDLTVYPDAEHDAWTRTYDLSAGHDIYAWLLEHALG